MATVGSLGGLYTSEAHTTVLPSTATSRKSPELAWVVL